jgi:hypothetical protein
LDLPPSDPARLDRGTIREAVAARSTQLSETFQQFLERADEFAHGRFEVFKRPLQKLSDETLPCRLGRELTPARTDLNSCKLKPATHAGMSTDAIKPKISGGGLSCVSSRRCPAT